MSFVKRQGKKLLNHLGQPFLLKGVGLGGWLLAEGYMWRFPKAGDRPRKIEKFISKHLGETYALAFWKNYRSHYICKADIRLIKESGYNSIRIPFNARHIFKNGLIDEVEFNYIDRMIEWCESYELYVILDMHGAPGGQTGSNIDDSINDLPELFIYKHYQDEAVALWRMIAKRYKDNPWIAGYDLLNEPLPEWFSQYNNKVIPLYKRMIEAIRQVDLNHMIILEGLHWSTDLSIFDERLDENILLQFHKYWNNPDVESIQDFLDLRERLEVPLFMGEGGENNVDWYTGAFHLYDSLDISWNFWTYKKMDNTNSLISVDKPKEWDLLVEYLEEKKVVDPLKLKNILDQYLNSIRFENSSYNKKVTHALQRQQPLLIPSIFYDFDGPNNSFASKNNKPNKIAFRESDNVSMIMINPGQEKVKFNHSHGEMWGEENRTAVVLTEGDWLNYSFSTEARKEYQFSLKLSTIGKSSIAIETRCDSKVIHDIETIDYSVYDGMISCNPKETLKLRVLKGCIQLEALSIGTTIE